MTEEKPHDETECWENKIITAEVELEKVNGEITMFKQTKRKTQYRNSGENQELVQLQLLQTRLSNEIKLMKFREDKMEHTHD